MRYRVVLRTLTAMGLLAGTAMTASAGEKSGYTLFSPTPDRLLRDMTTDRPDTTETPFTIDAGHIQIESNTFAFARSRPDATGAVTDTYELGSANLRIGLTENTEFRLAWQPYGTAYTPLEGTRDAGIGGVDIGGKINLWGNDSFERTGSALGVIAFVTLPTDRSNGIGPEDVEGGFIVPLALALPANFGLGINAGVVWLKDEDGGDYHHEYTTSAALDYEWTDKLGTYVEFVGIFNTDDPRGDIVVLGGGLTYALTKNLQLDGGVNFGVTNAADRFNPFVGFSQRF